MIQRKPESLAHAVAQWTGNSVGRKVVAGIALSSGIGSVGGGLSYAAYTLSSPTKDFTWPGLGKHMALGALIASSPYTLPVLLRATDKGIIKGLRLVGAGGKDALTFGSYLTGSARIVRATSVVNWLDSQTLHQVGVDTNSKAVYGSFLTEELGFPGNFLKQIVLLPGDRF